MDQPKAAPAPACPWCPYTDTVLKKVLTRIESAHHARWCEIGLQPIAGGKPI